MPILALSVEVSWTAVGVLGGFLTAAITFAVTFSKIRDRQKYERRKRKAMAEALLALYKLVWVVRHDQERIMMGMPTPLQPTRSDDSAVFQAMPKDFAADEMFALLDEEDE